MKPIRVQRKRGKGWRMPPNTIYVGRPSKWGNLFGDPAMPSIEKVVLFRAWIEKARTSPDNWKAAAMLDDALWQLRGKNLACWCPTECEQCGGSRMIGSEKVHRVWNEHNVRDGGATVAETIPVPCASCGATGRQPCHADVLLELANPDH